MTILVHHVTTNHDRTSHLLFSRLFPAALPLWLQRQYQGHKHCSCCYHRDRKGTPGQPHPEWCKIISLNTQSTCLKITNLYVQYVYGTVFWDFRHRHFTLSVTQVLWAVMLQQLLRYIFRFFVGIWWALQYRAWISHWGMSESKACTTISSK